ncbi:MAG: biopolymer transporter ExbD [Saprospiraceae bacterium]|nr:biopolymer transporter ExbD [Saprospiraceae bacterium]
MGLKKRNKVSAEFSMSSLTDIIFLLLIFFMLTSSLVSPNALFLKLPGKNNPTVSNVNPPDIGIQRSGTFLLDGKRVSYNQLQDQLRKLQRNNGRKKLDVTISPVRNTPVEHVVTIMDLAQKLNVNGILTTDN